MRPSTRAVKLEVVRIDDAIDPLGKIEIDSVPKEIDVRVEAAPVGAAKTERRTFLRTALARGETVAAATARLRKIIDGVTLPSGDRFAFESVVTFDPGSGESKADGVRSYVLTGKPFVTEEDVAEAKAEVAMVDRNREHSVRVELRPDAAKRFAAETGPWAGRRVAILIDDKVVVAPIVTAALTAGTFNVPVGPGDDADQATQALRLAKGLSGK